MQRVVAVLLAVVVVLSSACAHSDTEVCVVVRTYHKHAHSALDRFVGSLRSQRETRWHACFVNTDIGEYNLAERLRSFEDPRLHMAQEHAHAAYTDYNAYELTDKAVSCCPPDARWILFTNGDNTYSPDAFSIPREWGDGVDAVGMHFYSRNGATSDPLECDPHAFASLDPAFGPIDLVPCRGIVFENEMRNSKTDLGANFFRFSKWKEQDVRFIAGRDPGSTQNFDGTMMSSLRRKRWRFRTSNVVAFSHHPNVMWLLHMATRGRQGQQPQIIRLRLVRKIEGYDDMFTWYTVYDAALHDYLADRTDLHGDAVRLIPGRGIAMESNSGRFPRPSGYALPIKELGPAMRDEKLGRAITDVCDLWKNTVVEMGKHGQGRAYFSRKMASAIYLEVFSLIFQLDMPPAPVADPKYIVQTCAWAEKERKNLLVDIARNEIQ